MLRDGPNKLVGDETQTQLGGNGCSRKEENCLVVRVTGGLESWLRGTRVQEAAGLKRGCGTWGKRYCRGFADSLGEGGNAAASRNKAERGGFPAKRRASERRGPAKLEM